MKLKHFYLPGLLLYSSVVCGQMHIEGNMQIAPGSAMSTTSHVISDADVLGDGVLLFNGSAAQTADFQANTLPRLALFNSKHLHLASNIRIGSMVNFSTGKIALNGFNMSLAPNAIFAGATDAGYVATNGNGGVLKEDISTNDVFVFPIGIDTAAGNYTPLTITNLVATRNVRAQVTNYAGSAPIEGSTGQGIDRTWQVTSSVPGNAILALQHKASAEGPAFNRFAAFATQWINGVNWSVGTPNAGTNASMVHSDTFAIATTLGPGAYFSKSSNAASSLPVPSVNAEEVSISAAPNPFAETVTLQINSRTAQQLAYMATDAQGKTVLSGNISTGPGATKHTLNVNNLASGTYMLQVSGTDLNKSLKLIKK